MIPEAAALRIGKTGQVEPVVGRSESFDDFYRCSWTSAVRLAGVLAQDASVAEELAQESFVRMMPKWGGLQTPAAYLRASIVNAARQHHRHMGMVRGKLPLLVTDGVGVDRFGELADAVAGLPFRQRAVLVLRYYCDLSEREIAELLDCRAGTVKSLSSRALATLNKEISQ
jgi:DNA-directed RNA polymerase specialized sigma24 family protein